MKKNSTLLYLLLIMSTALFAQNPDPNFHIYLCIGQSNMEGNANIEQVDKTNVPDRFKMMAAADFSNPSRKIGNWYAAVPPLVRQGTGLTPVDWFGRTMVDNLPEEVKVGVIVVAIGGCKIEDLDKDFDPETRLKNEADWFKNYMKAYDYHPYQRLIECAKKAQQDGVIKGILLHQGCSNNGDKQWPAKVEKIYKDILADLDLKAEDVPLLAGELARSEMGGVCGGHNSIIQTLPLTIPNSYVISSAELEQKGDGLHFTALSYRIIGCRYAKQMLATQGIYDVKAKYEKNDPTPIVKPDQVVPIKVDGRHFVNEEGKRVLLYGVTDAPNPSLNGNRWGTSAATSNKDACLSYFDKIFSHVNNKAGGTYTNVIRFHLDPCWSNSGAAAGPDDFSKFDMAKFKTAYTSIFRPIITDAFTNHGLYVILRAPADCPETIQVGDKFQEYLTSIWTYVAGDRTLKKNHGYFMIELANEPRRVLDANGEETPQALHDYFQPIVDALRAKGFTGVILVPGCKWQQNFKGYVDFPITDKLNNVAYAAHCYPGMFGNSDAGHSMQSFCASFHNNVPVLDTNPVVITAVDWSPSVTDSDVEYNDDGSVKTKNLGTWASASTSEWGNDFKAMKDYFGNVSMTLSRIDSYINCDKAVSGITEVAFAGASGVDEACSTACFKWFKEYYHQNLAQDFADVYVPESSDDAFPLTFLGFNPSVSAAGLFDSVTGTVEIGENGLGGWEYASAKDFSNWKHIVIEFSEAPAKDLSFVICDEPSYASYSAVSLSSDLKQTVPLSLLTDGNSEALDMKNITMAGFKSSERQQFKITNVYFSNEDNPNAISEINAAQPISLEYYGIDGQKVTNPKPHHFYILHLRYADREETKTVIF